MGQPGSCLKSDWGRESPFGAQARLAGPRGRVAVDSCDCHESNTAGQLWLVAMQDQLGLVLAGRISVSPDRLFTGLFFSSLTDILLWVMRGLIAGSSFVHVKSGLTFVL